MREADEALKGTSFYLTTDDDALKSKADGVARRLQRLVAGKPPEQTLPLLYQAAQVEGVTPPLTASTLGIISRLTCPPGGAGNCARNTDALWNG